MSCPTARSNCCSPTPIIGSVYSRHKRPRFYVGPGSNEITLTLTRVYRMNLTETPVVKLKIQRHTCVDLTDDQKAELTAYAVEDDIAHFELTGAFLSDSENFPKGFYNGQVFIDDCHVDDIGIVKAASIYVSQGESIADKCVGDTDYVEPPCNDNEDYEPLPATGCDCWETGANGCPDCLTKVVVVKKIVKETYMDELDDLGINNP